MILYNAGIVQENADKDLFISILAQDLRSPFTSLPGLSDLLLDKIHVYNIDEIESLLRNIKNASQDTFALLEDLLKWTSTQSGKTPFKPQKLRIADICKTTTVTLNRNAIAKNITIKTFIGEHVYVFADIEMLKTEVRSG